MPERDSITFDDTPNTALGIELTPVGETDVLLFDASGTATMRSIVRHGSELRRQHLMEGDL